MNEIDHALARCRPSAMSLVVADLLTWYSPDSVTAAIEKLPQSEHTMNARLAVDRFLNPKPEPQKHRVFDIFG